ncbi:ABC transporter ATP-binding protein [Thalassospira sp. MA62]|nr:ABC transporter ATP-binding protein [Thalassospira sp. MA62]
MSSQPILSVDTLSAGYGNTRVLDGVSVDLMDGEFLALLGRSGCGKTTLLRTIGGFIKPISGAVRIDGRDVTSQSPDARPTAMVFQSYALWPHMTVFGNIAYGLKLRGLRRAEIARRIDETLALLRLDGLADRKVTDLSGGQRQRVALGRAIAVAPRLLLLDEPLSNLDARIRLDLRHEIRDLLKRLGVSAVHVTHDREEAMVMADRLALMDGGKIVQQGTPKELHDQPANSFVADFMGASNRISVSVRRAQDAVIFGYGDHSPEIRLPASVNLPVGIDQDGKADILFRSIQARLEPVDHDRADDEFSLTGTVVQATYPGDGYRYAVAVGGTRFMVDDTRVFAPDQPVQIILPFSSLHIFPCRDDHAYAA